MKHILLSCILLMCSTAVALGSCYRDVIEFSEGICAEFVGLSGEVAAEIYSGNLGANLNGLIERLADLDGNVDVEIARTKYQNILQEDVPDALREGRECRLEVAKVFFDRICPSDQSSSNRAPALELGGDVITRHACEFNEDSRALFSPGDGIGLTLDLDNANVEETGRQVELSLQDLIGRGQYGYAIAMTANNFRHVEKAIGPYSREAYEAADRYAFVLRRLLNSDVSHVAFVENFAPQSELDDLYRDYGAEIGRYGCIYNP